jgi:hypothetical protein
MWKHINYYLIMAVFIMFAVHIYIYQTPQSVHAGGGQRPWQGTSGIPSDLFLEMAQGTIIGHEHFDKFGKNSDIDTASGEDIWGGGGIYTGFPTGAAETMEVFSSDVDDTGAGTGARTVTIYNLLDSTGAQSPNITVTLNGTTPVLLGAITYYRGGTRIRVITAGSTGSNEGTLTLRHTTTTANIFAVMPVGNNQTAILAFTVPLGKTLYIHRINIQLSRASGAAGSASMSLRARQDGEVFNAIIIPEVTEASPYTAIDSWTVVTERTDVKLRCESVSDNNTIISGEIEGVLINN